MNVKRIIVDEVPEDGCCECCFSKVFTSKFGNDKVRCVATNKSVSDFAFGYTKQPRPNWCPLVVDECCEWVKIKRNYPDSNEPYLVYQTGCEYEFDDWKVMVDWVFCPNCGKRIKYVEVE